MNQKISYKQTLVLEAIEELTKEYGFAPTYKEIADTLKMDINGVFRKCLLLEMKGYIKSTPGKSRSIKVLRSLEND